MSFLSEISQEDRELLDDFVAHGGMRIFLAFVNGRTFSLAGKVLDDKKVDTMEKVWELRGRRNGFREVTSFLASVRNKDKNKSKVPSGE